MLAVGVLLSLRVDEDFERNHLVGDANDAPGTGGGGAQVAAGGGAHGGVASADRGPNDAGWLQRGCGADRIGPGVLLGLRVDQDFERNHLAGVAKDGPGTGGGGAPAAAGGEARYADTQTDNWSSAAGWLQGGCGADALGCDSGTVGCE